MKPVIGIEIGRKLCEALGIGASGVRGINIAIRPDALVLVTIERVVQDVEADQLSTVFEHYRLVRHGDSNAVETTHTNQAAPT